MANTLRTNGTSEPLAWKAGADNRKAIRSVFGERMITTFRTTDGRLAIADDNGLVDDLPHNTAATALYGGITPICGDVILLTDEETEADR